MNLIRDKHNLDEEYLIELGSNINALDSRGRTIMMLCIKKLPGELTIKS